MHAIASGNWQKAGLSDQDESLCHFAERLTTNNKKQSEGDINILRDHGLDDQAVHDATQIVSYFNYINRVADGLGVEEEDFIHPWEQSSELVKGSHDNKAAN